MHKLESKIRAAIDKYSMIEEGDRIAIGVSGGKDSMLALSAMHSIMRYYPKSFTITAITADPCFDGKETDFSEVERFCRERDIPYIIRRTRLAAIIFEEEKTESPCSLCAKMRRGILHNMCVENNLNRLVLGHHLDDAVQTFFMNLCYGGKIGCFSPVTYLSRKDLTMIRPLIFCEESEIRSAASRDRLPIVKSNCPVDGITARKDAEIMVQSLQKDFPDIKQKVLGAMQRADLDNWLPNK